MAEQEKKYYRQTYRIVVLSESPAEDELDNIARSVNDGPDCLHTFELEKTEEMTGKEAVDALIDAGSEPGFFRLDEDGNPIG